MLVFAVLGLVFTALVLLDALGLRPAWLRSHQAKGRVALAIMFLFAATGRLANPEGLVQMVPEFLPLRREAVFISGFFEMLGAIGLLVPRLNRLAGLGLVALLLVVFPANVNVAIHNLQIQGFSGSPVEQWLRLPLQFVLIGLLLWATQPPWSVPTRATERTTALAQELSGAHR
jgi:uncharacterized membrane protein